MEVHTPRKRSKRTALFTRLLLHPLSSVKAYFYQRHTKFQISIGNDYASPHWAEMCEKTHENQYDPHIFFPSMAGRGSIMEKSWFMSTVGGMSGWARNGRDEPIMINVPLPGARLCDRRWSSSTLPCIPPPCGSPIVCRNGSPQHLHYHTAVLCPYGATLSYYPCLGGFFSSSSDIVASLLVSARLLLSIACDLFARRPAPLPMMDSNDPVL